MRYHGYSVSVISRRQNLTADFLILWLKKYFCSLLGMFPEPDVQECLSYHITTNKKHIQKQLWEEKVYFILYFHVTVHPMEAGTGIQERKLEAETETMEECCLLVCSPPHGFFTLLC